MGAAAFVMIEFLEIPLTTLLIAAAVPAAMHFWGVFVQVHFEAKRLGLRGMNEEELPKLWPTIRDGWPTVIPLVALVWVIVDGYTPYLAAFVGITLCVIVGFLNPRNRLTLRDLWEALDMGARYALAVGAAAAAVGMVVGVVTLTGAGFRVGFIVTQAAASTAQWFAPIFDILPASFGSLAGLTLFMTLVFVALICIVMGAGIPTTALYIVLAAIAAPAVVQLGVPPLAAHLFILYYGILADLTPPVCVAAFAAAGIAGSNPFRTGLTAFRLGAAKATVPFVFAYAPVMLINAVSQQLPTLILAVYFGPAAAGFFALCRQAMSMPTNLIGKSVADVYYPRISRAIHDGEPVAAMLIKATAALALVGLVPFSLVVAFGPWLFALVFGEQWQVAGEFARWLALAEYLVFVSRPCVVAVPALSLQRRFLVFEIFSTSLRVLALFGGAVLIGDALATVQAFAAAGVVIYLTLMVMVIFQARRWYVQQRATA
ncbi:MAG: hypothetical protein B7Z23_02210 [Pseudomonadales bacterium 32-61-5]|nr:MAG: hypothetical protein B7Z23_02210 [Pseudomonadales bacterium 32-61-5]